MDCGVGIAVDDSVGVSVAIDWIDGAAAHPLWTAPNITQKKKTCIESRPFVAIILRLANSNGLPASHLPGR
jgi:hypothetical protein